MSRKRILSLIVALCGVLHIVVSQASENGDYVDLDATDSTTASLTTGETTSNDADSKNDESIANPAILSTPDTASSDDVPGHNAMKGSDIFTTKESPKDETTSPTQQDDQASEVIQNIVPPVQTGPFIELLGPNLLKLNMIDETHAQLVSNFTNEVLQGKKVVGLYFSADWCGPCRKFTPELNSFYEKINARRGRVDQFEIVWISRCRDVQSYGQYFAQMAGWLALPPEEAMGQRGQWLGKKFKVKSIPSLVLLDDLGNVITRDGRNKIPQDKAGIGFPWRNPLVTLYITLVPKSLRFLLKSQVTGIMGKLLDPLKRIIPLRKE